MERVQRIVVRDKYPVFEAEILTRPLNRAALGAAALALVVQAFALIQVIGGRGNHVGWFDHASFAGVAFLWWLLGVAVFLQRRTRRAGQLFLLSAAAGSIFLAMGTLSGTDLLNSLLYSGGVLLFPPLILLFTYHFNADRPWRGTHWLVFVPPAVLIWPMTQDFLHGQRSVFWKIAVAMVALYLLAAILTASRDAMSAEMPEPAAQLRALLCGLVAGTVPAIVLFVIPLTVGTGPAVVTTWQPPLVLIFLVAMGYAVLAFEFSEADLIVRRGIVYGATTLLIVAAYGVLGALLAVGRTTVISPGGGLSFVVVTIAVGAAFGPVRRMARRLVDWLLYGRRSDRWQMLQELSQRLSTIMPPDELGDVLVHEIARSLHLKGAFLLSRSESGSFVLSQKYQDSSLWGRRNPIPHTLEVSPEAVSSVLGSPQRWVLLVHAKPLTMSRRQTVPQRFQAVDALNVALLVPLAARSGLLAVLCLQPKQAHDAIDNDDLELLRPVMRQASAAFENALLFEGLQAKVEELRHAYARIAQEQELERARLARELHDGTAQEIASLITLTAVAERQLDTNSQGVRSTLHRLRGQAEDAYQGVRRASHALRPAMLDDFGLGPTLERVFSNFTNSTGIAVDYSTNDTLEMPADVQLALFRVSQECIENVRKHSGADSVRVRLESGRNSVSLIVADNGNGVRPSGEQGIGMAGMRERVEAVGGTVQTASTDEGFRVVVEIPFNGTK